MRKWSACTIQRVDMSGYKTSTLITIKIWLYDSALVWCCNGWSVGLSWCYGLSPCLCCVQIRGTIAFHVRNSSAFSVVSPEPATCVCANWFGEYMLRMCRREQETREREEKKQINFEIIYYSHIGYLSFVFIPCTLHKHRRRQHRHRVWNVAAPLYL